MRQIRMETILARIAFLTVLCGCGRPATRDDCERIFQRIVELELRDLQTTEAATVARKTSELRAAFTRDLDGCVGKRIHKNLVKCLEDATAAAQVDDCLR